MKDEVGTTRKRRSGAFRGLLAVLGTMMLASSAAAATADAPVVLLTVDGAISPATTGFRSVTKETRDQ